MPRYFFHFYNGGDARAPQGVELSNLDAALLVAEHNARFSAAETITEPVHVNLDHRIDIEDEYGDVLGTVYFEDVVEIEGHGI
jgi:hypothetical protein